MTKLQWLALLLGLLLVTAPLIRAEDDDDDDDDDASDDAEAAGSEDAVVVITKANFEDKIKASKFALVGVAAAVQRGDQLLSLMTRSGRDRAYVQQK